jgi:predicted transcriptional regulator
MTVGNAATHRLGELQLQILKVLWDRGEATVAQVHADLGGAKAFAPTTIATMLRKMERRQLVKHREEGRTFIYHALVASAAVTSSMLDHLVDRLFEGSLTRAVSHLLRQREVSRQELDELEKLIAERRKKR